MKHNVDIHKLREIYEPKSRLEMEDDIRKSCDIVGLSDTYIETLRLKIIDDFSVTCIAEELSLSQSRVSQIISSGAGKLLEYKEIESKKRIYTIFDKYKCSSRLHDIITRGLGKNITDDKSGIMNILSLYTFNCHMYNISCIGRDIFEEWSSVIDTIKYDYMLPDKYKVEYGIAIESEIIYNNIQNGERQGYVEYINDKNFIEYTFDNSELSIHGTAIDKTYRMDKVNMREINKCVLDYNSEWNKEINGKFIWEY